jgi:hypothetical protein
MNMTGVVLLVIGLLAVIGTILNWRIVSHSEKLLNRLLGDKVARAIYAAVGVLLIVFGVIRI